MGLDDYKAVVEVGEAIGARIQGLFILSEMDRFNILRKYPSTTWQGKDWDNSANISQTQIDIMEYIKNGAAYLEFGLHGVGHEYWADRVRKRAEWYCFEDGHPWDEKDMRIHIQCFKDIMAQYGLSEKNGHSFPESFVPCSFGYYWNPTGKYSTGKIMSDSGVKYVNTDFGHIKELDPPKGDNGGGFDNGVIVVNRKSYGNDWDQLSKLPTVPLKDQISDIIESHWSNWLAQDKFLQKETTRKWIDYYKNIQAASDRYIAKNTEQFHAQWLYKKYTTVNELKVGQVEIDNSKMPKEYYENNLLGNMVLKVELNDGEHISKATINNKPIACYFEDAGYGFIYLPILQQEKYKLNYKISTDMLSFSVFNDGTYNIYSVNDYKDMKKINLRVYGIQEIKIICQKPTKNSESDNPNLKIIRENYDEKNSILSITLDAHNIQGETGSIKLNCKEELNWGNKYKAYQSILYFYDKFIKKKK